MPLPGYKGIGKIEKVWSDEDKIAGHLSSRQFLCYFSLHSVEKGIQLTFSLRQQLVSFDIHDLEIPKSLMLCSFLKIKYHLDHLH